MPGFSAEANPALRSGDRLNESGMPFQPFLLWFVLALSPCLAHSLCTCLHCPFCLGWQPPWGDSGFLTLPQLQEKLRCAKRWKDTGAGVCHWAIHQQGRAFQAKEQWFLA